MDVFVLLCSNEYMKHSYVIGVYDNELTAIKVKREHEKSDALVGTADNYEYVIIPRHMVV